MYIGKTIRSVIYERDKNTCLKCGDTDNLTIDHILPISLGGSNHRANLQTLCEFCNQEKGNTEIDYREWPEYEPENTFDWGMSFKDMEEKYLGKKRKARVQKISKALGWSFENLVWDGKMPNTEKEILINTELNFTIYSGRKCHYYGHLNQRIGYGAILGQDVYYDTQEDKFILDFAGTKIAYHYKTLNHLVTKGVFKKQTINTIPNKIKDPIKDFIESYNNEPQQNFHYE